MKNGMIICLLALSAQALAGDFTYKYLVMTDSGGNHTSLATSGLTMRIENGNLVIVSNEGTTTLSLASLAKMEFSETKVGNTTTAIGMLPVGSADVEVFNLQGVGMGTFSSMSQARATLPAGIYIVKQNGQTRKITLK
ncbi:MAG: hypothetical protein IJT98_00265 [Prevotella sp.]|nr:hypothetical protein [Prevotella sp.]